MSQGKKHANNDKIRLWPNFKKSMKSVFHELRQKSILRHVSDHNT